jgi:hypothetical protein
LLLNWGVIRSWLLDRRVIRSRLRIVRWVDRIRREKRVVVIRVGVVIEREARREASSTWETASSSSSSVVTPVTVLATTTRCLDVCSLKFSRGINKFS